MSELNSISELNENTLIVDFNDNWILNINDTEKLILFLQENKFTKTLEVILEDQYNLNIIFEENDNCTVYIKKSFVLVESKIIYEKIMNKLCQLLCDFFAELSIYNKLTINVDIYKNELSILKNKYDAYIKDDSLRVKVNQIIKNIYDKKKEYTTKIFTEMKLSKKST